MNHLFYSPLRSILIAVLILAAAAGCVGQTAAALIESAKAATTKKDFPAAILDLTAAIKADPASSEAFFRRAYAYYLSGDYQKGLTDTDESIRLDAQSGTTYGLRGMINSKLKGYDAAVLDNTKAIELNPAKITWYYNRAVAYERKATPEWKLAEADLTKAVELGANDADTYYNRALARKNLEQWLPAENDYDRVVQTITNDAAIFIDLSYVNLKLGHYKWAVENAKHAIMIDPKNERAGKMFTEALGRYGAASPHSDPDLFNAVINSDFDAVMLALAGGADPNSIHEYNGVKNYTPLLAAALKKNASIASLLLKAGAKVDAADSNGNTPMRLATSYSDLPPDQRVALVSLLIKNRADVNRRDSSGSTPLIYACLYAYDEVLDALVKAGADVNANGSGGGVMSSCAGRVSVRGLKTLLAAGANVNAVDAGQAPPIQSAIKRGGYGIGQTYVFLRAGAELALPADAPSGEYKDVYAFVKRIKSLSPGSLELKLFDAVADDRTSDLDALLKTAPSLDSVLLNYLLLIAVGNDNGSITSSLIARGADPDFTVGVATAKTVALFGKKTAAAQYLGGLASTSPSSTNNESEIKLHDLLVRATSGIDSAKGYAAQINDMYARGSEKGLICVVAQRAKQELLYARQDLQAADKIGLVQFQLKMNEAKDNVESLIRSLNVTGCF
ncbi:MAG: ankyrin repeat domain-containing protein [Acidobacteriota bacterium]